MKNKNIFTMLILILISLNLNAQQFPYFSHVYINQNTINPALTGMSDQFNVSLIQQSALTGMPGNPKTLFMNANGPVYKKNTGLGLSFYKESQGISSKTGAYGAYAYKLNLDETQSLSLGFSLGALQYAIDPDMANPENANDPLLLNKNYRSVSVDGSIGGFYSNKKLEAGLAMMQMFGNKQELAQDVNFNVERNLVGSFKYKLPLSADNSFSLSPMIIARYSKSILPQDLLFIMNYRDRLWFVPSYSTSGTAGMAFSVKLYNSLHLGYAAQFYTGSRLHANQNRGHEIMVHYTFDMHSKTFKKQQNEIDDLYKRLKNLKEEQKVVDSLQNAGINRNEDSIINNKVLIKRIDTELQKTQDDLEKLKKQLIDAGLIRENALEEYESGTLAGYYLVVASVSQKGYNQKAMDREYLNKGYKKVFNQKRGWHYVYTVKPDDFVSALKLLKEARAGKHKDAWIHILK